MWKIQEDINCIKRNIQFQPKQFLLYLYLQYKGDMVTPDWPGNTKLHYKNQEKAYFCLCPKNK